MCLYQFVSASMSVMCRYLFVSACILGMCLYVPAAQPRRHLRRQASRGPPAQPPPPNPARLALAASILVSHTTTASSTGIGVRVREPWKMPPLAQVLHHTRCARAAAGPAARHGLVHTTPAPCLSLVVCHGRLVLAKIRMRLETPEAMRALQARPASADIPTRSSRPGHGTHETQQGVEQYCK